MLGAHLQEVGMATASVNGVALHYELAGSGEPLVLVHGAWGDSMSWRFVGPSFSEHFTVLTYDRRGHSKSERPPGQGSFSEDAADLAALIEHLDLAPAHVVGTSAGASIVLRLAGERPELFRSLGAHEPPLFDLLQGDPEAEAQLERVRAGERPVLELLAAGKDAEGARQFAETFIFGPGSWDQLPEETRETFTSNAPTFLDESRDPQQYAIDLERLKRFSAPALLTDGSDSPSFFPAVVARIAPAISTVERKTLPGTGHVPHITHPETYLEAVLPFLKSASTAT
jgi:pimeloyl-ACP methyl ester carboxylesterase